jgi:hypothetical protein
VCSSDLQLGTAEDVERLTKHIEYKKHQENEAGQIIRDALETQVLPEFRQYLQLQGIDPANTTQVPAVKPKVVKIDAAKIAAQVAENERDTVESAATALNRELDEMQDGDRYERLLELDAQGQLIPKRWLGWMDYYRGTTEYAHNREYYESKQGVFAVMYQRQEVK